MSDASQLWIIAEIEETTETTIVEGTTETTIVEGTRDGRDTGGGFGRPNSPSITEEVTTIVKRKRVPLDAKALKTQMDGLLAVVDDLFSQADQQTGMKLNEVELSVEINAEGQLSLVGNGGKLGSTGGITLKFVRPPDSPAAISSVAPSAAAVQS